MFKFIKIFKYGIYIILFIRIFIFTLSTNLSGSGSANEGEQSSSEPAKDPFKTTFEGELVNLDINAMHGYSKFNCTITYTEVVYQSGCKFKSALDGDHEIWKTDSDKNAFRFTLQFLLNTPLSLMIEFDRNDKSTALYYRRKRNSNYWEKIDENTHDEFVKKFKDELEKHKNSISNDNQTSVDLDVFITEANNSVELKIHKYKPNANKLSDGTVSALGSNEPIDQNKYKVTANTITDIENKDQQRLEIEMTDKKYRIYKFKVKGKANINSDAWKTGGTAYCTKIVGFGDKDKFYKFLLTLVYKDSGKRTELELKADASYVWLHKITEVKEVDLPPFDFEY